MIDVIFAVVAVVTNVLAAILLVGASLDSQWRRQQHVVAAALMSSGWVALSVFFLSGAGSFRHGAMLATGSAGFALAFASTLLSQVPKEDRA